MSRNLFFLNAEQLSQSQSFGLSLIGTNGKPPRNPKIYSGTETGSNGDVILFLLVYYL